MTKQTIDGMSIADTPWKTFNAPAILPFLALTGGYRGSRTFKVTTFQLYLLIAIYVLSKLNRRCRGMDLRRVVKVSAYNCHDLCLILVRKGYITKSKEGWYVIYELTPKAMSIFQIYQRMYRQEILRLRELNVRFEDL